MSTRPHLRRMATALVLSGALVFSACGDDDGADVRDIGEEDGGTGTGSGSGSASTPSGNGSGTGSAPTDE